MLRSLARSLSVGLAFAVCSPALAETAFPTRTITIVAPPGYTIAELPPNGDVAGGEFGKAHLEFKRAAGKNAVVVKRSVVFDLERIGLRDPHDWRMQSTGAPQREREITANPWFVLRLRHEEGVLRLTHDRGMISAQPRCLRARGGDGRKTLKVAGLLREQQRFIEQRGRAGIVSAHADAA